MYIPQTNRFKSTSTTIGKCKIFKKNQMLRFNFMFAYLKRIDIHGADNVIHLNRTIFERCLWLIIIFMAIAWAAFTASIFLQRHINHPLVMSIERDYTTWNTTFPSFTICSKRKMNETALAKYLR